MCVYIYVNKSVFNLIFNFLYPKYVFIFVPQCLLVFSNLMCGIFQYGFTKVFELKHSIHIISGVCLR